MANGFIDKARITVRAGNGGHGAGKNILRRAVRTAATAAAAAPSS